MCFETTKSARAKIAKKDIECWKLITKSNRPRFDFAEPDFRYKPNKTMPLVPLEKEHFHEGVWEDFVINQGYHSYKSLCRVHKEIVAWPGLYFNCKIAKFIIPKGTRYYENKTQYVSETIMLVE